MRAKNIYVECNSLHREDSCRRAGCISTKSQALIGNIWPSPIRRRGDARRVTGRGGKASEAKGPADPYVKREKAPEGYESSMTKIESA